MNKTRTTWMVFAAAALGLLVVYYPALRGGFVWDDVLHLRDTAPVQAANGLPRIWFTTECRDYYPLSYSVFWLEWHVFAGWTTGYHIANVLLHAAGAVLLWRLLERLQVPGAWLGALLFAVDPVNVPSVAWISELKNVLAFSLAVLAVLMYFGERRRIALGCFVASLLAKPAAVGLPAVLLAVMWWRQGRLERGDWLRIVPFVAVAAALGVITIWFQHHRALQEQPVLSTGWLERAGLAGAIVWFYLLKAIAPVGLSTIYPAWPINWNWIATSALFAAAAMLWWQRDRWGRGWLAALVCFAAMLFPVLGFFEQGYYHFSPVADHWLYFALPVVCALAGRIRWPGAIVAVALAVMTWSRCHAYANDEAFWKHTLARNPRTYIAHYCLANHLARQHDPAAITHLEIAVQLNPDYAPAHYNLGILLGGTQPERAAREFREVLRLEPNNAEARRRLEILQGG